VQTKGSQSCSEKETLTIMASGNTDFINTSVYPIDMSPQQQKMLE